MEGSETARFVPCGAPRHALTSESPQAAGSGAAEGPVNCTSVATCMAHGPTFAQLLNSAFGFLNQTLIQAKGDRRKAQYFGWEGRLTPTLTRP